MGIFDKLFGKKHEPRRNLEPERQRTGQPPLPHEIPRLLAEFDGLKEVQDLGSFLKRHSEQEIASFIEAFPFSEVKLDYASVERDFRNCRRMELLLHLASMLLRWRDYSSDPKWEGLLPPDLNAGSLYSGLSSRLFSFLEAQRGTDIAMVLRTGLYDFATDLIREDKNREAMICLEISRPSPKEDHDFWLCACYHNIGKLEKDAAVIRRGVKLAEGIMSSEASKSGDTIPIFGCVGAKSGDTIPIFGCVGAPADLGHPPLAHCIPQHCLATCHCNLQVSAVTHPRDKCR